MNNSSLVNVKGIFSVSGNVAFLKSLFVLENREIREENISFCFISFFVKYND